MTENFTTQTVQRVAELARLRMSDEDIQALRPQLAAIIQYIDMIGELDVEGVEPMAHPLSLTNRLAEDMVEPSMDASKLLDMAPAVDGEYLSVPKVIGEGGG